MSEAKSMPACYPSMMEVVYGWANEKGIGQEEWNRRCVAVSLAAAAPELYEVCQAIVKWDEEHFGMYSEHNPDVARLVKQAKAALAKVEGR